MIEISPVLIANRGEIACRIARTAQTLGLRTVAVYSEADSDSPHVRLADRAVAIGPSAATDSYLDIGRIVAAARQAGARSVHPGYGFLSENAAFAGACREAGLVFVGPPEQAIHAMGDKARAKRLMIAAGVPCVPGYHGEDQSEDRLVTEAEAIGLPVMVKAAAGGGGRGMRLVTEGRGLADAIRLARSEAENAFGSGALVIEKAILRPRHVEIQVFADAFGTVIHLGERDCSVQRRHQKVIEEAPCPAMTETLRAAMGAAAVEAARAVDYRGAGTVEFLLDDEGAFYFLEMNTRLQVEHPVTEAVTGLDLVALQFQVAAGAPLGLAQADIALAGHAIEVRLYAEDAANGFLPNAGPIRHWQPPEGEGIRVDAGIATGGAVTAFYDPMVAKIIASGATRDIARRRLVAALGRTALFGIRSNRDFLIDALEQPVFAAGRADTGFIADTYGPDGWRDPLSDADPALAAVLQHALRCRQAQNEALGISPELLDWSSSGDVGSVFVYAREAAPEGPPLSLRVRPVASGAYRVDTGDTTLDIAVLALDEPRASLLCDGTRLDLLFHAESERLLHIATPQRQFSVLDLAGGTASDRGAGERRVVAPMHGRLLAIAVGEGDRVAAGDRLAVLEAMKMQHELLAGIDGTVTGIHAQVDSQVAAGEVILELAPLAGEQGAGAGQGPG